MSLFFFGNRFTVAVSPIWIIVIGPSAIIVVEGLALMRWLGINSRAGSSTSMPTVSSVIRTRFFVFLAPSSLRNGVDAGGSWSKMGVKTSISPTGFFFCVFNAVDILDKKTFRSTNLSFVLSKILISIETSAFFFCNWFHF